MFKAFFESEAAGGVVLMVAAALALGVANSALAPTYFAALATYVGGLSVLHWVNDALMAVFFLLVGLEIKREILTGELSSWSRRVLPGIAAVAGVLTPALVYLAFNAATPATIRGWAIPTATDIAFALGVLALLGPRVPTSLKVFLAALAIIDDLAAVLIIAFFYTTGLSVGMLAAAGAGLAVLVGLNLMRVTRLWPYLLIGAAVWFFVLKSGVHATIAGVAVALAIPLGAGEKDSPLLRLEHALHKPVAFVIVPIFGFANAGVSFAGMSLANLLEPVPLGIALGLFAGKLLGVSAAVWGAVRLGVARLPEGATPRLMVGVAALTGIGFTMSLFIGMLAFADAAALQDRVKIGVLLGSLLSGVLGYAIIRSSPPIRTGGV